MTPQDSAWGIDTQPGSLIRVSKDGTEHQQEVRTERGNYPRFYQRVRDAVLGSAPNPVPQEQGLAVMHVIEAGRISHTERREVLLKNVLPA
jgi:predicted dehydrogenase